MHKGFLLLILLFKLNNVICQQLSIPDKQIINSIFKYCKPEKMFDQKVDTVYITFYDSLFATRSYMYFNHTFSSCFVQTDYIKEEYKPFLQIWSDTKNSFIKPNMEFRFEKYGIILRGYIHYSFIHNKFKIIKGKYKTIRWEL
jgi:hypothetical protein